MVLLGTRGGLGTYWGKEGYFGILQGTVGTGATGGCCAEGLRGSVRYCGLFRVLLCTIGCWGVFGGIECILGY